VPHFITRRDFCLTSAATLLAARIANATATTSASLVPALLDHILLGCNDLDHGIAFVEQHTGVRAAFGGVHPGRGTQNALLSIGDLHYLEIIAPDPKQPGVTLRGGDLRNLAEPKLVGWAARPKNISEIADRLTTANIAHSGPTDGSRRRPDGTTLHWSTIDLADDHHGLLPFFIQWSADSKHPSLDAPPGCRLTNFAVLSPDSHNLAAIFRGLELDVAILDSNQPRLTARIEGPKGTLDLIS
jgi:hypothetical protein